MPINRDGCIQALSAICGIPTAPFYEARVAAYILARLQALGLTYEQDEYGNILATYAGPNAPAQGIAYVAHMDHPAFEVTAVEDLTGRGRILGGLIKAPARFPQPQAVRIYPDVPPPGGQPEQGIAANCTYDHETEDLQVALTAPLPDFVEGGYFGVWDLPLISVEADGAVHLCVADDLAGCAAILLALEAMQAQNAPFRVYAVFTRAEEVGLFGATLFARSRRLPPDAYVVSIEISSQRPGIALGSGAIIRSGDARMTFDDEAEAVLRGPMGEINAALSAEEVAAGKRLRRMVMDGGSCEASRFIAEGYKTTGLVLQLQNYHNCPIGDQPLAPEIIHIDDMVMAVQVLTTAPQYIGVNTFPQSIAAAYDKVDQVAERLKSSFAQWS